MSTDMYSIAAGMTLREFKRFLQEGKVDIRTLRDERTGSTLLHNAMHGPELGKTKLLLSKGADVNARNDDGEAPLHSVLFDLPIDWRWEYKMKCVKLLLEHGAEVNVQDNNGRTPLHWLKYEAARFKRYGPDGVGTEDYDKIEWLLITAGADTDIRDNHGETIHDLTRRIRDEPWV
jgi:hypothetical protein